MEFTRKKTALVVIIILSLLGCGLFLNGGAVYADDIEGYKVRYVEEGTDNDLIPQKVVTNKIVGETVVEVAPEIRGAVLIGEPKKSVMIGQTDLITFYYAPDSVTSVDIEGSEEGIQPYGDSIPLSKWNVSTKGAYELDCDWNRSVVYSNYWLTGAKSYEVRIRNWGTDTLRVRAKTRFNTYEDVEISAGITKTFWVKLDSTSDSFYFRFDSSDANCNFRGTVTKFK